MRLRLAFAAVVLTTPFALASAGPRHAHLPRQAPPSSSSSARPSASPSTPSSSTGRSTAVSGASVTPTVPPAPTAAPSPVSFSLLSTNPTAVPLASIVANEPSGPTQPIPSPATPGTTPSLIPGAPALPNPALLSPANYPPLDKIPPIDSPQVQQWIQDVKNSGVQIPDIPPTNPGGCANNSAAVADTSRCWWTCTGCTGDNDVTECPTKNTWGLTYDDGPGFYTTELLSYLDEQKLKSTFFVVGSRCISYPAILQAEYNQGHQIAVHTWSHPSLTTLTNEQIIAELGWSLRVIKDVLGVTPNQMRPPFGDIDNRVRAISLAMGLTPVMWTRISPSATFDTGDFNVPGGTTTVEQVLSNWESIMSNVAGRTNGFTVLEHDLFEQTVQIATGYILPDAMARNLTIEPVITCLKKDLADAYVETNDNKTNPPPTGTGANGIQNPSPTSNTNTGGTGSGSASGSSSSQGSGTPEILRFSTAGVAVVLTSLVWVLASLFTMF